MCVAVIIVISVLTCQLSTSKFNGEAIRKLKSHSCEILTLWWQMRLPSLNVVVMWFHALWQCCLAMTILVPNAAVNWGLSVLKPIYHLKLKIVALKKTFKGNIQVTFTNYLHRERGLIDVAINSSKLCNTANECFNICIPYTYAVIIPFFTDAFYLQKGTNERLLLMKFLEGWVQPLLKTFLYYTSWYHSKDKNKELNTRSTKW